MSQQTKENLKRLWGKNTTAPDADGDLLTRGNSIAAVSGDITGAQGVSVVDAGAGTIEIGLENVTPDSLATPTANITNLATVSGLVVEQNATFNRVTPSGESPVSFPATGPSGIVGPIASSEWLEVTVNGNVRYIPLFN